MYFFIYLLYFFAIICSIHYLYRYKSLKYFPFLNFSNSYIAISETHSRYQAFSLFPDNFPTSRFACWDGVTITGGIVNAESEAESAILARDGACSISGDATSVTAITNAEDKAAIRNAFDGGIYLDAAVKAENTAGGKPVEGVMKDKTEAITIGAGFDAFGLDIYTTENGHSYFIPAGSDGNTPWAGEINICKHVWNAPVWSWSDDYSAATATFVCTKDETHKEVVQAVITSTSKDATCGENGVITYRASLTFNGTVYEDEQSKVIPATGNHSYKDGICTVCGASDPDYQPTEPEEPGESETPSEPSEPSEPVDPSTPDDSHPTETPATGYNSNAVFVVVLLFLSGAGALGMTIYSRKKTKRE